MEKKFVLYRKLPLLVSYRIPDRTPPALSYPTKTECMASIILADSPKNTMKITPKLPRYIEEFIEKVHGFLVENVIPEPKKIDISWSVSEKKFYGPGLTVFLAYTLVNSLEKFYEEDFSTTDRVEIYSKILYEQGFPLTEAKSLIYYFETEKASLYSITGEKQSFTAEPIDVVVLGSSIISPPSTSFPNIILDYLSKLSSVLVVELSSILSRGNNSEEKGYFLRANNSIWNIIYNYYPQRQDTILLPGHPSEILETRILSNSDARGD